MVASAPPPAVALSNGSGDPRLTAGRPGAQDAPWRVHFFVSAPAKPGADEGRLLRFAGRWCNWSRLPERAPPRPLRWNLLPLAVFAPVWTYVPPRSIYRPNLVEPNILPAVPIVPWLKRDTY